MNSFMEYIKVGNYTAAKLYIENFSHQELHDFIVGLGFDTGSIALYTFVALLLIERESPYLHYCAAVLMGQALVYVDGAYSAAFFHAQRAMKLAPDDPSYKEYLLLYYYIPDRLLSYEKARRIAESLLIQDPQNSTAKQFFLDTVEQNKTN